MSDDIVERIVMRGKAADEIRRLRRYERLVRFIAGDYWELSQDKVRWLYTEYKTKCRELLQEDGVAIGESVDE